MVIISKHSEDGESLDSDRTENASYMSELDEHDILAAKKRLNFQDDAYLMQRLKNPVSSYTKSRAHRLGQKHKKLFPFSGEGSSSSDMTRSLLQAARDTQ